MYILGISCFYHDSSITLLKDDEIVFAAEEERFSRKKHDFSFPFKSIEYCLKSQNISIDDIDYVGFYEKPILKFERVIYQHIASFPRSYKTFISSMPSWFSKKLRILKIIKKKLKYQGDVIFIPHHMSHAASSFFASDFKKAAILNVDGVGEWTTTSFGIGKDCSVKLLSEIKYPHSLGLLYSTITAYLGFSVNSSEYKVMGLSSYGSKNKNSNIYYSKFKEIIDVKNDGSFHLNMSYFKYHYSDTMPGEKMCSLFDGPVRGRDDEVTQRHKDIAAALQIVTEETVIKILNCLYEKTNVENLVFSGGVALNSVLNGKILKKTPFKNIFIQPAAGDGGASMGVAFYIKYAILGNKRENGLSNVYLGPSYEQEDIKKILDYRKIKYKVYRDVDKLIEDSAKLIYKNFVVGWFQGRMEWGPRALGNRSILANPLNRGMQEILNSKVKHREEFRPFAPAICYDDVLYYFDCDEPVPDSTKYMLMVYPIKKEWQDKIPGVVHVDGSGRLQTVNRKDNKNYYDLIKKFGELSGVPIIINTSFNVRGEPIVCSPEDAINCMMNTEIDYLVMDRFLIKRSENL